jgi:hypothetical protein
MKLRRRAAVKSGYRRAHRCVILSGSLGELRLEARATWASWGKSRSGAWRNVAGVLAAEDRGHLWQEEAEVPVEGIHRLLGLDAATTDLIASHVLAVNPCNERHSAAASAGQDAFEVLDRSFEPLVQGHGRAPLQQFYGAINVRSSANGVVGRQGVVFDRTTAADQLEHL